jgi:hypothetical protein
MVVSPVVTHAPPSRNFHFVNVTKASGTRDKTAQKLVRSYAARRQWQHQRKEDVNLFRTQLISDRCTCPFTQVVNTTVLNGSSNLTQLQRRSDLPLAVPNTSDNTELSLHLPLTTASPTEPLCSFCGRAVSISRVAPKNLPPLPIMRVGNSDPFSSFPVETQPHMHEIIDHCMYYSPIESFDRLYDLSTVANLDLCRV